LKAILNKFEVWMRASGLAENSIKTYLNCITVFLSTVKEDITEEIVINFIAGLSKKYKPTYVNKYLNALRAFKKFSGLTFDIPKYFKVPQTIPDSFSLEFLENEILSKLDDVFSDTLKIKTLLYFMFYSGLRKGELVTLKRSDFNLDERIVKVYKQKQQKEHIVIYPPRMAKMLDTYFHSEGEEENAFNLGTTEIDYIIRTLKENFPELNIRATLFRHSTATHLLKQGVDLLTVRDLMGHASINSTMKYLGNSIQLRKEIYDKRIK
jgi:integrase/recombinase XerD